MTKKYVVKNIQSQYYYGGESPVFGYRWYDDINEAEYFDTIEEAQSAMSKMIGIFQIETVYFCN